MRESERPSGGKGGVGRGAEEEARWSGAVSGVRTQEVAVRWERAGDGRGARAGHRST